MKYRMTEQDFKDGLRDSVSSLRAFADLYDRGESWAFRPMANVHRMLFHSKGRTTSLLKQLNSEQIWMFDSAPDFDPQNLIAHNGLSITRISADGSNEMDFVPRFVASSFPGKWVDLNRWWSKVVYSDYAGAMLGRKDFVLNVCEQDLGTHADRVLDNEAYARLSRKWFGSDDEPHPSFPLLGCEKAYLRQITYEVLLSLDRQGFTT